LRKERLPGTVAQRKKSNRKMSTFTYDPASDTVITGKYHPTGGKTAHEKLVNLTLATDGMIGGSIKADGTISLKSETLNPGSVGKCDAAGTDVGNKAIAAVKDPSMYMTKTEFCKYVKNE
jgi:hypothetical protein